MERYRGRGTEGPGDRGRPLRQVLYHGSLHLMQSQPWYLLPPHERPHPHSEPPSQATSELLNSSNGMKEMFTVAKNKQAKIKYKGLSPMLCNYVPGPSWVRGCVQGDTDWFGSQTPPRLKPQQLWPLSGFHIEDSRRTSLWERSLLPKINWETLGYRNIGSDDL